MDQSGVQKKKHRACDECRLRKVACTKEKEEEEGEEEGCCARCRREKQACHYSAQKPMGRPRKLLLKRDRGTGLSLSMSSKRQMTDRPPDTRDPGMRFINLLLGDDLDLDPAAPSQFLAVSAAEASKTQMEGAQEGMGYFRPFDYSGFALADGDGDVDFGFGAGTTGQAETSRNGDADTDTAALFTAAWNDFEIEFGTTAQEQIPELSSSSPSSSPAAECACLANLYSALNSMRKLPSEAQVERAIRQARLAARVAYEVVNCPVCLQRPPYLNPHLTTTTSTTTTTCNFQTLMLLATLIPSIAHAYERMLEMVDEETRRAIAARRSVTFKLDGFGGV
ncbi:hypothetical protein F5Y17DRAFT_382244 [Xylariaceae sp. FL0594]|nr:hypothetical protein F5Y17DRAFT_382244 [Xylariaceae sp. FL0594]